MCFHAVPPRIVTSEDDQVISTIEGYTETLTFFIEDAHPPVIEQNIAWYFSRLYSDSPFAEDAVDITGQTGIAPQSMLIFSDFVNNEVNVTLTNIVQGRSEGEPTDAGRYFLVAVNPAGLNFAYIDLVVLGNI